MLNDFCRRLGMTVPVIQAPMAGTSTAAMAAAVSDAGGLGSIALGAVGVDDAERIVRDVRQRTTRPFSVNVFCHRPARAAPAREAAWIERLAPLFRTLGAAPPERLREIYTSFVASDAMLQMIVRARPAVVSFHFGVPSAAAVAAIRKSGAVTMATATNLSEAAAAAAAGIDAIVAQGYEAGGHRGAFDPDAADDQLGTLALVRLLVKRQPLPVIAAGGIMDGAGVAAALALGAVAAQLGTAFILCPESAADDGFRAALRSDAANHTTMTRVISGRSARCLANAFTSLGEQIDNGAVPDYPIAYDAGKALNAAAKARGDSSYGAQWAGQGAPLCRALPAAELVAVLRDEICQAQAALD